MTALIAGGILRGEVTAITISSIFSVGHVGVVNLSLMKEAEMDSRGSPLE